MTSETEQHLFVESKISDIPSLSVLNAKVLEIVKKSSWMDLYGYDWLQFAASVFIMLPCGLSFLSKGGYLCSFIGIFLLACYHSSLTARAAHLSAHSALAGSNRWNKFWCYVFTEFLSSFSTASTNSIHIKSHHPHTNIVGLGDSSVWKAPFLPRSLYMFVAPLSLNLLAPIVAIQNLIKMNNLKQLLVYLFIFPCGVFFHVKLIQYATNYSFLEAFALFYIYRSFFSISYIHINIFQHIGLPMYSIKDRPARIVQMANGCLNLSSNFLFDFVFGHSLISCHIEHHLYPNLSDNMCLKVKPVVRNYLKENGLPYKEVTYLSRLFYFMENYNSLMVKAPPITHFVGIL